MRNENYNKIRYLLTRTLFQLSISSRKEGFLPVCIVLNVLK